MDRARQARGAAVVGGPARADPHSRGGRLARPSISPQRAAKPWHGPRRGGPAVFGRWGDQKTRGGHCRPGDHAVGASRFIVGRWRGRRRGPHPPPRSWHTARRSTHAPMARSGSRDHAADDGALPRMSAGRVPVFKSTRQHGEISRQSAASRGRGSFHGQWCGSPPAGARGWQKRAPRRVTRTGAAAKATRAINRTRKNRKNPPRQGANQPARALISRRKRFFRP